MAVSMPSKEKENENTRTSLELLYHISRELTTALELRTVLERVLFLSMRTVGAITGSIVVLDDNEKPVESAIIIGEQVHNHTTQRLRMILEKGLAGWVVRNKQAALATDTSQDSRWMLQQYDDEERSAPKSAVSTPLLVRDRLIGVMTLVHSQPGFFNADHVALIQAISDQAGIAVLNARLYAESQRQARVMTALAETAAIITASLNLEDVLTRILEQTSQALDVQAVSLALLEPETDELAFHATTGWVQQHPFYARVEVGKGVTGWVAHEGRGIVIQDAHADPRFDLEVDRRTGLVTKAIACAPLRYRGQVIGVLEAINPAGEAFDADALMVLTGIGSLAGTAVRHAQLFERLQAAHKSYRELFEDSIDPILITNLEGRILEANRKAVFASDYDKEYLHRMTISQLHSIDYDQLGTHFENLASDDSLFSYESRLRTRSGHEVPIQVYVRQVKADGAAQIQWILRDITERRNLDTMREDLISMIYHDLRSPLANVVSSLDVLETMLLSEEDPAYKSLLNIAMRSVERIQRLTNSLLDINRLEAGQPVGNRQPTEIFSLVEEAMELIEPIASNKQQSLSKELPLDLPAVLIDPEMIRRVITNLLENAAKFTSSGGKLSVGAKQDGDWLQVWVQDTGPGIPATEHERIFDKFTRLNPKETAKGLGLGLAYCKLAVSGHGGRIWVESEPGAGARFWFTLPVITQ